MGGDSARRRITRAALTSAWASWPHATQTKRASFRLSIETCRQTAHVCEAYCAGTRITTRAAYSAFSRISVSHIPNPASLSARFKPAFAATLLPGFAAVPRAERIIDDRVSFSRAMDIVAMDKAP